MLLTTFSLYWHTIRYLKFKQIIARIYFRFYQPRVRFNDIPSLQLQTGAWLVAPKKNCSLLGASSFCFLNETHDLNSLTGWDDPTLAKLWRYNLHYFDCLQQEPDTAISSSPGLIAEQYYNQLQLIRRWIAENPFPHGSAWEPYPSSLRLVNWIKFLLSMTAEQRDQLMLEIGTSLVIQTRYLFRRIEYHILGNHILANAKALIFAGIFFTGGEAEQWLARGLKILDHELAEQILADGGHFELSPMYHSIIVEDFLDLSNLFQAYAGVIPQNDWQPRLSAVVASMLAWLQHMCHADSEISFFNDAAMGIAQSPAKLIAYAQRLGIDPKSSIPSGNGLMHLKASGYIRYHTDELLALLDVGEIGPGYLPGHAHADNLSFELSLFGRRFLVNSGTSSYGFNPQRQFERSTAAHNTVVVNGANSSEVWASFRVARRAMPVDLQINADQAANRQLSVSCAHDGYTRLAGAPLHQREWQFKPGYLRVSDKIKSSREYAAQAYFYLHPEVSIDRVTSNGCSLTFADSSHTIQVEVVVGSLNIATASWRAQFGRSQATRVIIIELLHGESSVLFRWN